MKLARALFVLMLTLSFTAPFAAADEDELKAEINALKARLAQLEEKLSSTPAAAAPGGVPTISLPSMVQGIEMSGFVDSTYAYNFNHPDTLNPGNRAHVFDRHANSFNLNAAELVFKKNVSAENRLGFRTDLYFGNDAEVIGSAGLGTTDDEFDVEQAYIETLVSLERWSLNDLDVKIGKFVTPFGAEVIESKDNWNTSRSFLFGYAIPFTHTGVLANYSYTAFNHPSHAALGVVNGWDNVDDNNKYKTVLANWGLDGIAIPDGSTLGLNLTFSIGTETAPRENERRLFDLVLTYQSPWKPLRLMYNLDYGHEENLVSVSNDANWWGHAFYARYDINDKWALSGRTEYFDDTDGVRAISGTSARYWEITGTLEYRPWTNLITRLEYRHDDANNEIFFDRSGFDDVQNIIMGEVIYSF